MARIRTIKPEHTLKKKIGYLSDRAYRLWIALICNADDEGRGDLDADEFRAKAYGFQPKVTEKHVQEALTEVFTAKLAYQYSVNGKLYYQMHQWEEHQKIQHPSVSKIPPCPAIESNEEGENNQKEAIHETSGVFMNPHEDSLLIKDQGSRIKDQGIYIVPENSRENSPSTLGKNFPVGLIKFIEAHPYGKQYKLEAAKVWHKLKLEPLAEEVVAAVELQKTWPDLAREGFRYFIRPGRYLRDQHWKDEPRTISSRASPSGPLRAIAPCDSCSQRDPGKRHTHWLSFADEEELKQHFYDAYGVDEGQKRFLENLPWWKTKRSIIELNDGKKDVRSQSERNLRHAQ